MISKTVKHKKQNYFMLRLVKNMSENPMIKSECKKQKSDIVLIIETMESKLNFLENENERLKKKVNKLVRKLKKKSSKLYKSKD